MALLLIDTYVKVKDTDNEQRTLVYKKYHVQADAAIFTSAVATTG